MYNLGIPEIQCLNRYEDSEGRSIKYDVQAIQKPQNCLNPECENNRSLHMHSTRTILLQDVKSEGKLVYLNLKIKRYRCPVCGKVVSDAFTFFQKKSHLTNRLKDEFISRCINGETFSYIARDYSLNHKTISSVFYEYANTHKEQLVYDYTPEVLGIDEAHIDDHYRLVLTDIKKERLLDMKKDRKKTTVKAYLRTLDQNICKCATMDFLPMFASAVHEVLPGTVIVVDKFHVVQEVNRCLDQVRIAIQNKLRKQGVDVRKFKHAKRLFQMNLEDLSDEASDRISQWFSEHDELYEAYMCKETFRDIYSFAADKEEAAQMFELWLSGIPEYKQFSAMKKTFSTRKEHILNYWDWPVTNAYTESINNRIKSFEKAGRGYKFDNLRILCLLGINKGNKGKFNPREASYHLVDNESMKLNDNINIVGSISRKQKLYQIPVDIKVDIDEKQLLLEYLDSNTIPESRIKRLGIYAKRIKTLEKAGD